MLFLQLRRLMDALQAKVSALYGHHREPSKNVIEFRSGRLRLFGCCTPPARRLASLAHLFHHPALHPGAVF